MTNRRQEQVSELVRQELASVLTKELEFPPGALVTVSRVAVSADLEHAKVFLSFWPPDQRLALWETIDRETPRLQQFLNRRLVMEHIPRLTFHEDESEDRAARVNALLDSLDEDA